MNPDLLADFPVVLDVAVRWGDMDAFGHVNNTLFFRYFEIARIEYLVRIEFREGATSGGVGPILASTHCRFRRPLTFPDTAVVGARGLDVSQDRFTMEYRIFSRAQDAIAAEGGGLVVAYDYGAGSKAALPEDVKKRIAELESSRSS